MLTHLKLGEHVKAFRDADVDLLRLRSMRKAERGKFLTGRLHMSADDAERLTNALDDWLGVDAAENARVARTVDEMLAHINIT